MEKAQKFIGQAKSGETLRFFKYRQYLCQNVFTGAGKKKVGISIILTQLT